MNEITTEKSLTIITPDVEMIGFIIGRCGNIIILVFILLNQITALSLIVGIKGLVRKSEIEANPAYYLVGSFVNLTFSILISLLIKLIIVRYP